MRLCRKRSNERADIMIWTWMALMPYEALMMEAALRRSHNSNAPPPSPRCTPLPPCGPCIIRCRAKSPNWGICLLGTGRSALQKAENLITRRTSTWVGWWSRLLTDINQTIRRDCGLFGVQQLEALAVEVFRGERTQCDIQLFANEIFWSSQQEHIGEWMPKPKNRSI